MALMTGSQDIDANFKTIGSNESFNLESTWTFAAATTGSVAEHTVFTVTGNVIALPFGIVDTDLTSGGSATISMGVSGNVLAFIGSTTATGLDDGDVWLTTSGTAVGAQPFYDGNGGGNGFVLNDGADIIINIGTATITAGAIDFYCLWRPLSSDGNITVTTPA